MSFYRSFHIGTGDGQVTGFTPVITGYKASYRCSFGVLASVRTACHFDVRSAFNGSFVMRRVDVVGSLLHESQD